MLNSIKIEAYNYEINYPVHFMDTYNIDFMSVCVKITQSEVLCRAYGSAADNSSVYAYFLRNNFRIALETFKFLPAHNMRHSTSHIYKSN